MNISNSNITIRYIERKKGDLNGKYNIKLTADKEHDYLRNENVYSAEFKYGM